MAEKAEKTEKAVIADLLKTYRKSPPRNQTEFAAELNISRKLLSSMELKLANPSWSTLMKLAKYGGLSILELLWTKDRSLCPKDIRTPPLQVLAGRVLRFRKGEGASQEHFAECIGISVSQLSRIERGLATPCLETLLSLARHMGIPAAEIFIPDEKEGDV